MQERFDNRPRARKKNPLPLYPEDNSPEKVVARGRFPSWLHRRLPQGNGLWKTHRVLSNNLLPTVCEEARCPNILECYSHKTATFLAMGKECTRACGFCDIDFSSQPKPLEVDEPARLARTVKELGLRHVVITQVARDDLPDGGAGHLVQIIRAVRRECPGVTVEILSSDLCGKEESLDLLMQEAPEIFNHNIETVRRLTPSVRHKATYERTLSVLQYVKKNGKALFVKSGIMLGLGESEEEVKETLADLSHAGCDIVTLGQYLQPSRNKIRVKAFVPPEQFDAYAAFGKNLGILHVYAGPFVRSSYNASEIFEIVNKVRPDEQKIIR